MQAASHRHPINFRSHFMPMEFPSMTLEAELFVKDPSTVLALQLVQVVGRGVQFPVKAAVKFFCVLLQTIVTKNSLN
jgi:hypothetical protein